MSYRYIPLLFAIIATCIFCNRAIWKDHKVLTWDASGYYMYLPCAFIYHDLGDLKRTDSARFSYAQDMPSYGINEYPATGNRVEKYPIGTALLELPFFCVAHYALCPVFNFPRDGFSMPYQFMAGLSSIFWVALGLLFIGALLRRYHSATAVIVTLLVIGFGTNVYFYTAFRPSWSHPYSFFLLSCLLYETDTWKRGGRYNGALCGLLLGMLTITRPVNILFIIIPLLWPGQKKRSDRQLKDIATAFACFCAIVFSQCCYWHYTTGHWVYYSYIGEGFDFTRSRIGDGLFSFRLGWFVYTPLAFIMVCAIPLLWKTNARMAMSCLLTLSLYVYVAFCWHPWHYAGGFSSRPMVDVLPLMALPMAALASAIITRKKAIRTVAYVLLGLLIGLNIFQTYQISIGVIDNFGMSRAYYFAAFGKLKVSAEDRKLILTRQQVEEQE